MKKLCIINTGGTITSKSSENGIEPAFHTNHFFHLFPRIAHIAEIEGDTLFHLDSSNVGPHHWTTLVDEIFAKREKYDGFVILHGTDTLAYTTAALSFALKDFEKPIVFTAAEKPLTDNTEQTEQNFLDALRVAADDNARGVLFVFHGQIFRGVNIRKIKNEATVFSPEAHLFFENIGIPRAGEVKNEGIHWGGAKTPPNPPLKGEEKSPLPHFKMNEVAHLAIYPGMSPEIFSAVSHKKAILLSCFAVGHIPEYLHEFVRMVAEKIPVFITSQNAFGGIDMDMYAIGRETKVLGVYECPISTETALVKLAWILGNREDEMIVQEMGTDYCGEIWRGE